MEPMKCDSCQNENAMALRYKNGKWGCDVCDGVDRNVWVPDVYFRAGEVYHNIDRVPRTFSSRRDKALFMKSRGIVEAGDRVGGDIFRSRFTSEKKDAREEVKRAFALAKKQLRG